MRNSFLTVIFLFVIMSSYGQIIITDQTIITPPAPAPSVNPVDLSNGISVEYNAENEITLTDGFWVKENTGGDPSTYFLARIIPPVSFAVLKNELDGSYCSTIAGKLYFKYEEKYTEGLLTYQIYDYKRTPMIPIANQTDANGLAPFKTIGSNFLSLNLNKAVGFVGTNEVDSYYTLEVTNDKGDKYLLRFKYLTSTNFNY